MSASEAFISEDAPCPLDCSRSDMIVLKGRDRLHGLPGEFTVVRCQSCGLMRTNPRPTPETIGAFYPANYAPHQPYEVSVIARRSRWKTRLSELLGLEPKQLPTLQPGRLLEIGCASGAYLAQMRDRGWAVEGVEFSERAAALARELGLSVQVATIESAQAPTEPVDLIAAWMVIEHLHDPVGALKRLRTWIKPNGFLVASVPDADAWINQRFGEFRYDLQLPNHLYHFTPSSISKVLAAAGWKLTRISWQRNCNTLLWSAEYLAQFKQWRHVEHSARWVRSSKAVPAGRLRTLLGLLLGVTRQSGRMEIWAKPAHGLSR